MAMAKITVIKKLNLKDLYGNNPPSHMTREGSLLSATALRWARSLWLTIITVLRVSVTGPTRIFRGTWCMFSTEATTLG